jgi:serine phosphatase RsbU (regulator of sigma subunit)
LVSSDGLGDITNKKDELFQDNRFRPTLTDLCGKDGTEVIEGLVQTALEFGEGQPPPDDISLLALTRK